MLQCVAAVLQLCRSVLQCDADVRTRLRLFPILRMISCVAAVLQLRCSCAAVCSSVLQCVAMRCCVLQSVLQSVLPCVAVCC